MRTNADTPEPDQVVIVDGRGLLCAQLLLRLRRTMDGEPPETIVHVLTTDPAAPLDLPYWCHLTGHTYLGPQPCDVPEAASDHTRYGLRVRAEARRTLPDRPYHLQADPHHP